MLFIDHPDASFSSDLAEKLISSVAAEHDLTEFEVSVILISDDALLAMNRKFLDHDYRTDVITFPLEEEPLEGEIYISYDRALEQAAEHEVSTQNEIARLIVHGMLHLCGHDDADPADRRAMSALEDRYLALAGVQ